MYCTVLSVWSWSCCVATDSQYILVGHPSGAHDQIFIILDICSFIIAGRLPWWEDWSVIYLYNCYWPLLVMSQVPHDMWPYFAVSYETPQSGEPGPLHILPRNWVAQSYSLWTVSLLLALNHLLLNRGTRCGRKVMRLVTPAVDSVQVWTCCNCYVIAESIWSEDVFVRCVTKMDRQKFELCCAIKFCVKLGEFATVSYEKLQWVYEEHSLSRTQVFRWHKSFIEGEEQVEDETRARCTPIIWGVSFIYILKSVGYRTELCGTLTCIILCIDIWPTTVTQNFLLERRELISLIKLAKKSNFENVYSKPVCHNRSTLDIGVLGYIGILYHKEHPPEVWHIPSGTPCIYKNLCMCVCVCRLRWCI
jgi:hypothetical protein